MREFNSQERTELVTGPTSVKLLQRDAAGNITAIEEYASLVP